MSAIHVGATVTWKLIIKGPVDTVPQSGLKPLVFTNLQPGPKFNPLGYVFCKSHNQYPDWVPPPTGFINGIMLVHFFQMIKACFCDARVECQSVLEPMGK